jgi:RHH-type proline utilization regulon transcriptional repressor/proline dehydrogenase/delta 1-pyrroline-5-carboxylate dehydrogenase
MKDETPSIFDKGWWIGKLMDWCMRNQSFKVQLFRFIDVLPCLHSGESLSRHVEEYFAVESEDLPAPLKWGAKVATVGGGLTAHLLARTIKSNIASMAKQFIIGENAEEAVTVLTQLRQENVAFTVDLLGEATVSKEEARGYQQNYRDLLHTLGKEQIHWPSFGNKETDLDWGCAPKLYISVKPSSLYSQTSPADFEGSVQAICARFEPILSAAEQVRAFVRIDMEQYKYKDITLEVYRRLRCSPEFSNSTNFGLVLQSYLRDTDRDLQDLLDWSRLQNLPCSIRLVKGAYWDYETVIAEQNGWQPPVYTSKAETDAAFERQARKILENHDIFHLACGSHNVRTISAVLETAKALEVPENRYEFQVLYGMAEPVRKALLKTAKRVRVYCPYGELLPGMAYLVRRLLENTANESFLRQSFAEERDVEKLLADPAQMIPESKDTDTRASLRSIKSNSDISTRPFCNHPVVDFTCPAVRSAFPQALVEVRKMLGRTYPLLIGPNRITTEDRLPSINPAKPTEVIGYVCQAGTPEIDSAIQTAQNAFPLWRDTTPKKRAQYLFRAAEAARKRIYTLAAWQVLEVGKQWDQAYADVAEAIDFLEYYGREMIRLGDKKQMGSAPGELNHYFYQPKGVAAIIAPWNFPLAISCGMSSAAIVTGNCAIYKPSGLSAVVGFTLAEIFQAAGLPQGVFNYTPGRSSTIGDYLVDHPDISVVAFTGSMETGLRILERTNKVRPGQTQVKKVIAEMGGKNAIIIDDDADLDEAVVHVLQSAFGYQGQKCSACSRVIVLEPIYHKFVHRLVQAAESIHIGPPEEAANYLGPVIDHTAQQRIQYYIEIGKQEGKTLLCRDVTNEGYYVPLTIFADIKPEHRLAQEEIFGPVLSIMKAETFEQAISIANSTTFALTGGVFSRSPKHLQLARKNFRVGNLYLNRGITGAMVERQPFGGFKMSGVGSKAGGPDYLLQFMEPRSVTENTLRRGFVPPSTYNKDN